MRRSFLLRMRNRSD